MIKQYSLLIIVACLLSCNSDKNQPSYSKDTSELQQSINRGEVVYNDLCVTCHLPNGKGVPKTFPPLAESDYLEQYQVESIKSVKYGMKGEIVVNGVTYNNVMAPMGLSDAEVADVMNYINNAWGNQIGNFITEDEVSKIQP
ncbi:MAG: cytochrome c [Bacteroidota bacterium]